MSKPIETVQSGLPANGYTRTGRAFVRNDRKGWIAPADLGPTVSASIPEATGAADSPRRAVVCFVPFVVPHAGWFEGLSIVAKHSDNSTMTTIETLKAKFAINYADGDHYISSGQTAMPLTVVPGGYTSAITYATARANFGSSSASDSRPMYLFPFANGPIWLEAGLVWVQVWMEIQYAGESPNSLAFASVDGVCRGTIFNTGSDSQSGWYLTALETDITGAFKENLLTTVGKRLDAVGLTGKTMSVPFGELRKLEPTLVAARLA
jgi:hypothetical protein